MLKLLERNIGSLARRVANALNTPAVILLYHRVTHLCNDPQELAVRPDYFRAQVQWLKTHYNLVDVDAFTQLLNANESFPPRTVLLTFDDGYADNLLEALPVLEEYQVQALFYITTSKLNTLNELWWDDLERILLQSSSLPVKLDVCIDQRQYSFSTSDLAARQAAYVRLQSILRFCKPVVIENALTQLYQWSQTSAEGRSTHRLMTHEEVSAMAGSASAVIGCHTHRHPALGMLSLSEQMAEIGQSKEILEALTRYPIRHFSYPFGARKFWGHQRYYNLDSFRACRSFNFDFVCANYYGQVHSWSNRLALPRILVRNWSLPVFQRQLENFFKH